MDKFLSHLRNVIMGVILGVFAVGIPMSLIWGQKMWVGIVSAVVGIVLYYGYLLWKGR
jgi:hypothetical protein